MYDTFMKLLTLLHCKKQGDTNFIFSRYKWIWGILGIWAAHKLVLTQLKVSVLRYT